MKKGYKRHTETTHHILSKDFEEYYYNDDDEDGDYYYNSFYSSDGCRYEYLEDNNINKDYIVLGKRRGLNYKISHLKSGLYIDMNSIYSKEVLRQKKIDVILGNDVIIYEPNTIESIIEKSLLTPELDTSYNKV